MAALVVIIMAAMLFDTQTMAAAPVLPARCQETFCEDLLELTCPDLPPNCTIGKPGFFGWETLSTDPCNCCPYCIAYLELDDICPVGQATGIAPDHMCGPGLYCVLDIDTRESRCKTMVEVAETNQIAEFNMDCSREQVKYDQALESGTAGNLQLRPECDGNGLYAPHKCIPGEICYCQDEYGSRIFGEIPFSPLASKTMHCGCSRHNAKAKKHLKDYANTWTQMRCMPDGSFEAIQCLDDACLCVDTRDGVPTYPLEELVNITAIDAGTMHCFDNKTHTEYDYYQVCEDSFNRNYKDDMKFRLNGYDTYGAVYANCQMDGKFASIQSNKKEVYCADPDGVIIEDYRIPLGDPDVLTMNCKCARANLLISGLEKPVCSRNGNYKSMQCRRGECRCVDENGNQVAKEVPQEDADKLDCDNQGQPPSLIFSI